MITALRALVLIAAAEAVAIATIYLVSGAWRRGGRVGWFLLLLGGSIAWLVTLSVLGWWWVPPLVWWLPGLLSFDLALALWLHLMLRRIRSKEDKP